MFFRTLLPAILLFQSQVAAAGLWDYFREEDGHTNWQYVANWSSGILILLLTIAAIILYSSRRQIKVSNQALKEINDELETRVQERTATLNESNELLQETNELLKEEIDEHLETTRRLHASETYIKSILESMPLMVAGLDKSMRVTQWNKAAENITGLEAEMAMHRDLWQAYPIMPVTREQVEEALNEGTTLHMRRTQRGQFHYEITVYPLEEHAETGLVILLADVTQQVRFGNKLIERDKISAMGELASSMAHDITPPLQAINNNIDAARNQLEATADVSEASKQQVIERLLEALDQGQQANAITRNLLQFARSQNDTSQPIDVTALMEHSLDLANDIFALPGDFHFGDIQLVKDYEEGLPLVPCIASEMQQVFLSILRHSFYALSKATFVDKKPTLTVRILECYDNLWVKIQNNGKGLSSEEQQFIFEPYFVDAAVESSADYDASHRLSFSHFIITEHHKGHIAVTSDEEVGTTFHIQLQLK